MNESNFNKLINQIKEDKMTSIDKAILKHRVMSFVNTTPVKAPKRKIKFTHPHPVLHLLKLLSLSLILIISANSISNTLTSVISQNIKPIKINIPDKKEAPIIDNTIKPIDPNVKPVDQGQTIKPSRPTKVPPNYSSDTSNSSDTSSDPSPLKPLILLRNDQINKLEIPTNPNQKIPPTTP